MKGKVACESFTLLVVLMMILSCAVPSIGVSDDSASNGSGETIEPLSHTPAHEGMEEEIINQSAQHISDFNLLVSSKIIYVPDNYSRIQWAVDNASAGDTIIVRSGTYYENVNVTKQLILRGVDTGTSKPVVDANGSGSTITISADGCIIDGFKVTGGYSDYDAGIKVHSNSNTIKNNIALNNWYGIRFEYSSNNTLKNNIMTGNSYNFGIPGMEEELYYRHNIDTSNTVDDKPIYYLVDEHDSIIDSSTNAGYVAVVNSSNIVIKDLMLTKNSQGVLFFNTNNSKIENIKASNDGSGIHLRRSNNNILSNNTICSNNYGINLYYSSYNTITSNNASNNYYLGIILYSSSDNKITNNNVSNNYGSICLSPSSNNNTITNNIASNNNLFGIQLGGSSNNNIIANNVASNNNKYGISIIDSSYNLLMFNNVSENSDIGVLLFNSSSNFLTGNNFNLNHYGIYMNCFYIPSRNMIWHNNFINNGWQAYDRWGTNWWSIAYPEGGNYWSDYTGTDNFSGPSQNIPGSDGIGDTPYSIYGKGTDWYPFMRENGWLIPPTPTLNSTYTKTTPIIDGNISHGEWLNPINITLNGFNNPGNTKEGRLYVMNDNQNIYVGVVIPDSNKDADYLMLDFDQGNDHIANVGDEDAAGFGVGNLYSGYPVGYGDYYWDGWWWSNDSITHGSGAMSYSEGKYIYEFSKPLNSDDQQDMKLKLGDIIGFRIETWDTTTSDWYRFPGNTVDADTSKWNKWADLTIAKIPTLIFDTGSPANPYPSISGMHNGTIKPNQTITVSKLYTYPCPGTGGHTEYVKIWNSSGWNATASWNGYVGDWHNITFPVNFTIEAGKTYNYTIRTGSYPQIHHTDALPTKNGWINCTEFVDANGRVYYDWIPAIRLWS